MTEPTFHNNSVIAHRGAWKALGLPENSIASLRQAIVLNCGGTEFDVHLTADEVVVVYHDDRFHGLDIENHTYTELRKFTLTNGEPLPALRDYLIHGIKNNAGTRLIMEIKPSAVNPEHSIRLAKKVNELAERLCVKPWITLISFDLKILEACIALDKNMRTQYLNGELPPASLKALGISGPDYSYKIFKNHPEWITEALENKLLLNTWTVNKPSDMDFFIQAYFDFITTDEPELLLERIKRYKRKSIQR